MNMKRPSARFVRYCVVTLFCFVVVSAAFRALGAYDTVVSLHRAAAVIGITFLVAYISIGVHVGAGRVRANFAAIFGRTQAND